MKPLPPCLSHENAISIVVIGKNEGERLIQCLESIAEIEPGSNIIELIYVDSQSEDDSVLQAARYGARVLSLKGNNLSAAAGRNAGWRAAKGKLILFLDADTRLDPKFLARALRALHHHPDVAVIWGHRRELWPKQSLYVEVMDLDWIYPPGMTPFCGGDALMRREVLENLSGFDERFIAGEEPELCRRIRAQGWQILHIDAPMTGHDLAITSFRGYWRRAERAGFAYAAVSSHSAGTAAPLWQRESQRNLLHGTLLLLSPLLLPGTLLWPPMWFIILLALGLLVRTYRHIAWKSKDPWTRLLYCLHSHFQQLPILLGQLRFYWQALGAHSRAPKDYKRKCG